MVQTPIIFLVLAIFVSKNEATPSVDDTHVLREMADAAQNLVRSTSKSFKSNVRNIGKAGGNGITAAGSVVDFAITETDDGFKGVGHLFSKTLPQHTNKIKSSASNMGSALLSHTVNNTQRVLAGAEEIIKGSEQLADVTFDQFKKVNTENKELVKSLIEVPSTAAVKVAQAGKTVFGSVANFINQPTGYINSAIGYISPKRFMLRNPNSLEYSPGQN